MAKLFNNPERVECVRWSPGSCGRMAAGTALLLAASAMFAAAQENGGNVNVVTAPQTQFEIALDPVLGIDFEAGVGQVFELQGSTDLRGWRDIGDAVFGDGDRVSHFFVPGNSGDTYRYFRVKILPSQAFGFAPPNLVRHELSLNDDGGARRYTFFSRSSAVLGGDEPLTYSYLKLGDTRGRLTIDHGAGDRDQIDLNFSADLVGTYTRSTYQGGEVSDVDRGTFSVGNRIHPSPDPSTTVIPASLVGRSYIFSDGTNQERLDFVTDSGGRAIDRATVDHFSYEFEVGDEIATATISQPGDITVEFEMLFGLGSDCGTYVRREFVDGTLEATDEGIFSCADSIYHGAGATSTNVTLPADELTGHTYLMRDGGTVSRLNFQTHRSGRLTQGSRVEPFDFSYVVKCNATSAITITVGDDDGDYDEYHLNHTDMTFVRNEVRGGEVVDSDTGTFSDTQ